MLSFIRKLIPVHKLSLAIHDIIVISSTLCIMLCINTPYKFEEMSERYILSFLFLIIAMVFIFKFNSMYKYQVLLNAPKHIVLLSKSMLISMTLHIYFAFFMKFPEVTLSRRFVLQIYFLLFAVLFISRVIIIPRIYYHLVKKGILSVNMLVLGAGEKAKEMVRMLKSDKANYYKIIGFLDDSKEKQGNEYENVPVLGSVSKLKETVLDNKVNDVFVFIKNINPDKLQSIIDICKSINKTVHIDSSLYDIVKERLSVEEISSTSTFRIVPSKSKSYYDVTKRIFDILVSSFLIIVLFPVWLVLFLMVKFTSKGPGFYKGRMIGKDHKEFYMLKFRSMYHNTSKQIHEEKVKDIVINDLPTAGIDDDPRITPVGRIMRKYSIDEFPQLWNVLVGDMSLVGPRPNVPYEYEHMKDWQKKRFDVLPGMTGLWQIKGRDEVKFTDQIALDFYYIENRSLMLDLEILLKTIPVVLFGKGGK